MDTTKRGQDMETILIFFLIAVFGVAVVLGTLLCFVLFLLDCEVE